MMGRFGLVSAIGLNFGFMILPIHCADLRFKILNDD